MRAAAIVSAELAEDGVTFSLLHDYNSNRQPDNISTGP
jgi:hypothetical protein